MVRESTAPAAEQNQLKGHWAGIFEEIPVCTQPGCCKVAYEVDAMFPYLDDFNRCTVHLRREPNSSPVTRRSR